MGNQIPILLDNLTPTSREFYEQTKFKVLISLTIITVGLFYLGLCSDAGADSAAAKIAYNSPSISDYQAIDKGKSALIAGYGFSSFCYIMAFCVTLYGGFYVSPFVTG